jgi:hypothetical protein
VKHEKNDRNKESKIHINNEKVSITRKYQGNISLNVNHEQVSITRVYQGNISLNVNFEC